MRIYTSRHVKFIENVFSYFDLTTPSSPHSNSDLKDWCTIQIPLLRQSSSSITTEPIVPTRSPPSTPIVATPTTPSSSAPPPPDPPRQTKPQVFKYGHN